MGYKTEFKDGVTYVNWTEKEKEEIIERAREIYCEKRRRKWLDGEPPIKKKKTNDPKVIEIDRESEGEEAAHTASKTVCNNELVESESYDESSCSKSESEMSQTESSSSEDEDEWHSMFNY